jgi:hypothetical protein
MPRPAAKDRVEGAKSVVMLDRALLNAEIANGPYKKDPEVVAKEIHYEPLPCEVRAVVIAAGSVEDCCLREAMEQMAPKLTVLNCSKTEVRAKNFIVDSPGNSSSS